MSLSACGGGGGGNDSGGGGITNTDTSKPQLSSNNPLSPINNANNIPISSVISVSFNEAIDSNTLTSGSFIVIGSSQITGTISYNNTTYTATFTPTNNLAYGTTYTATLTTNIKDIAGNNFDQSFSWSFTTESAPSSGDTTPPNIPGTPSDIGQYSTATSVMFSWTPSYDAESGVAGYRLQIGTSAGAADVYDENVGNVVRYTFTGTTGQTLFARVSAVNGDGLQSDWSASSDGITIDTTPPETPSAPTDDGEFIESNDVTFTWTSAIDPETGISSYSITIYSATNAVLQRANTGTQTTYTYTGAIGQTVYARISATNNAGWTSSVSPLSDGITILGPLGSPVVTGPASPTGITTPTWTWTTGGGGSGTYRYKFNDSDLSVGATETSKNFYAQTSALADGTYTLYVQEQNSVGTWSASGFYSLTIDSSLSAGDSQWTRQFGSLAKDDVNHMATDADGNFYIVGETQGDIAGTGSNGGVDAFIAKYDPQGNRAWIIQYGTTGFDTAKAVTVDNMGNSYVTGRTSGVLPGVSATSSQPLYIIKYDSAGNRDWATQYGDTSGEQSNGIALDSAGNIYTVGNMQGTDIGSGGILASDIFINKHDPDGNEVWRQRLNSTDHDFGDAIAIDSADNVYITGSYTQPPKILAAKYDSDGNQQWLRTTSGGFSSGGNDIAVDEQGNTYITGTETDDLYLATRNGFVTKYDADGNRLWYRSFGVAGDDYGNRLVIDNAGNTYVTGFTEGDLAGTGHLGARDVVILKYKTNGDLIWRKQMGTAANDAGQGIALGADDTIVIAGSSEGGMNGNINLGSSDVFLLTTTAPPLTNADLNGSYLLNGQQIDLAVSSTEIWSWAGQMTFDGAGGCSYVGTHERGARRQDAVSPRTVELFIGTPDSNTCSYSLAGDGTLTINGNSKYMVSRDTMTIIGIYSAGVVESMVKESSGGLTDASLNGTYLINAQATALTPTSTGAVIWADEVSFDGAGNCSYSGSAYVESAMRTDNVTPRTVELIPGTPTSDPCTYSLAGNGVLTINGSDTYALSEDGNTIIGITAFADSNITLSTYEAMVRKSSLGLTNASLTGTYKTIGQATYLTVNSTEAWSWKGVLSFDGAGNCLYEGDYDQGSVRNDIVTPRTTSLVDGTPQNLTCTYNLSSDGTLTINGESAYSFNPETGNLIGVGTISDTDLAGTFMEWMVK